MPGRVVSAPMSLPSQRPHLFEEGTDERIWHPARSSPRYWDPTPPASSQDTTSHDSPPSDANGEGAQATAAPTIPPPVAKRERRSSICKSIIVSWPKPGKVAVLGYGKPEMAEDECASFNREPSATDGPRKLLCGHMVTAILGPEARPREAGPDGAPQAPQPSRAASKVTVFFGPLPNTTDSELRRQIRTGLKPGPRQVAMVEYTATIEETKVAVESLLRDVAPVESFCVFDDSTKTRLEAAVCFQDLDGALKAFVQLNNSLLPFFPEGKLRVHLHDVNDIGVRCHKKS